MSKAEERARDLGYWKDPLNRAEYTANDKWDAFIEGYKQAEKDVAEAFARIIRGNLSMMDRSLQYKFEQLYTDVIGEKMYKGFID